MLHVNHLIMQVPYMYTKFQVISNTSLSPLLVEMLILLTSFMSLENSGQTHRWTSIHSKTYSQCSNRGCILWRSSVNCWWPHSHWFSRCKCNVYVFFLRRSNLNTEIHMFPHHRLERHIYIIKIIMANGFWARQSNIRVWHKERTMAPFLVKV